MMMVSEACNYAKLSSPGSVQVVEQPTKVNSAAFDCYYGVLIDFSPITGWGVGGSFPIRSISVRGPFFGNRSYRKELDASRQSDRSVQDCKNYGGQQRGMGASLDIVQQYSCCRAVCRHL